MRSRSSRRRVPARRSQMAFMRGAWTAVRRIVMPADWKTASKDEVKFDPRSRTRNLMSSNRSPKLRARLRACCTVHSPAGFAGDAAKVHPAGAMFDEHQDMQSPEEHGVHVQEIDRDDPGGLGVQELPPARARASRCRIDACGMQDLPHGGRRDRHAELREFAVDAAMSPQRILPRQADERRAMAGT